MEIERIAAAARVARVVLSQTSQFVPSGENSIRTFEKAFAPAFLIVIVTLLQPMISVDARMIVQDAPPGVVQATPLAPTAVVVAEGVFVAKLDTPEGGATL
jgi:hypothetical protein